jgi:hypothetical protein
MRFRVFTNDVGPKRFSALRDVTAATFDSALEETAQRLANIAKHAPRRLMVAIIPHDQRELWPNGKTGVLPDAAFDYVREVRYGR